MAKKRAEPEPVDPVVLDGVRYEAPLGAVVDGRAHTGGVIVARDDATGERLWQAVVYTVDYEPEMESDKQDVFITRIAPAAEGRALAIAAEDGSAYRLELDTRSVTRTAGG